MKKLLIKDVKEIFLNEFSTEVKFKSWWLMKRKERISQSYDNKPIMGLPVDNMVFGELVTLLKLENVKVVESDRYPTPVIALTSLIRNYKNFYAVSEVTDEVKEEVVDEVKKEVKVKPKKSSKKKTKKQHKK